MLYRSAQPTVEQIENLIAEQGLRTLVIARDGDSDRVRAEMMFAAEHGLNVLHVPIESRQRVPDDVVRRFLDCVDDPAQRPLLVHCSAGRHRTGYLCALYRIERQDWTVDRAVDEMLSFGFDTKDHAAILEQLRAYRPGSTAAGRGAAAQSPSATEAATP